MFMSIDACVGGFQAWGVVNRGAEEALLISWWFDATDVSGEDINCFPTRSCQNPKVIVRWELNRLSAPHVMIPFALVII